MSYNINYHKFKQASLWNTIKKANKVSIIVSVVAVLISLFSYVETNKVSRANIQPNLIITSLKEDTLGFKNTLWNVGPGVAYDINCEVHLARNQSLSGDIGGEWIIDVLQCAYFFYTKDSNTIRLNRFSGNFDQNPPTVLPPGIEFGYSINRLKHRGYDGLFIILRYKDGLDNPYFSIWNGYNWVFGKGETNRLPYYPGYNNEIDTNEDSQPESNPLKKFVYELYSDPYMQKNFQNTDRYQIDDWLKSEFTFWSNHGFPILNNEYKKVIKEARENKLLNSKDRDSTKSLPK